MLVQLYVPDGAAILPRDHPPSLAGLAKLTTVAESLGVGVRVLDMRNGYDAPDCDLTPFQDRDRILAYLRGGAADIDTAADAVLKYLGFAGGTVVGLSLSLACMIPRHDPAGRETYVHLAAALAKRIYEQAPSTVLLVGGLRPFATSEDRATLEACFDDAPIDHVVLYEGEAPIAKLFTDPEARPDVGEKRGRAWWWTGAPPGDVPSATLPTYQRDAVDRGAVRPSDVVRHYRMHSDWGRDVRGRDDPAAPLLQFSFIHGCPGRCAFCSQAGTELRMIPVERVVDTLLDARDRLGCHDFTFINSQLNASKKYAEAFCDELIARDANLRWSDSVNCRSLDEHLLDKMRRAGAIRLVFGVETPDERLLRYVRKGTTLDRIERMLRHADALGIWNHVLLIAGMPHETAASVRSICGFVEGLGDAVNHATVSAFYLPMDSPFQKMPQDFDLELLESDGGHFAFREVGGLSWEEKKAQIQDSADAVRASVARATRVSRASKDLLDLPMLHLLYRRFGHDGKRTIQRIYRMTFASDLQAVLVDDPTLETKLGGLGLRLQVEPSRCGPDCAVFSVHRAQARWPLELVVGVLGTEEPRWRGERAAFAVRSQRGVDGKVMRVIDAIGRALVERADGFFRAREARAGERARGG